MPLDPPDLQHLNAAQGFCALGMYEDANAELEEIDPFCRALPEVLEVRLHIYQGASKWELMQQIATRLAEYDPNEPQWVISWAYATRRAESLEAANKLLADAVETFPEEPIIHYNLGCYACQLGDLDSGREHLKRAFALEPKCREIALDDADLQPLWNLL